MTVMADLRSLLPGSRRLFFLLLHLACVFFFPAATSTNQPPPGRRRTPPSETSTAKSHEPSSVISYFRHVLFFYRPNRKQEQPPPTSLPLSPSSPLHKQLRHYLVYPERAESDEQNAISRPVGVAKDKATGSVKRPSFTSPADVFLCASCGEIFNRVNLLELHQATRHAFSELHDSDAGKNIVRIIFQSAWKTSVRGGEEAVAPAIHRILKIHHSPRTLARFEEYRDAVRSRATATRAGGGGGGDEERCAVDGNESLRFYCTTFLCRLGGDGNTATCGSPFCTACWIVRHGFSGKEAEGISMYATGSGAHASLPEELEREFAFMRVRRAMIVCRVVAGRVRPREAVAAELGEPAEDRGYDSVAARGTAEDGRGGVADELLVFNPRAVLPCFVVVYGV